MCFGLPVVERSDTTSSCMKPLRGVFFVPHGTLRVAENEPSGFVLALGGG